MKYKKGIVSDIKRGYGYVDDLQSRQQHYSYNRKKKQRSIVDMIQEFIFSFLKKIGMGIILLFESVGVLTFIMPQMRVAFFYTLQEFLEQIKAIL